MQHPVFTKDVTKAIGKGIIITDESFCCKAEEEVRCFVKFKYVLCLYLFAAYQYLAIMLFILYRTCEVTLQLIHISI